MESRHFLLYDKYRKFFSFEKEIIMTISVEFSSSVTEAVGKNAERRRERLEKNT